MVEEEKFALEDDDNEIISVKDQKDNRLEIISFGVFLNNLS